MHILDWSEHEPPQRRLAPEALRPQPGPRHPTLPASLADERCVAAALDEPEADDSAACA